jgi:hypothetical protein
MIFRIDRILRSKDIDFRCDHIVNNCNIAWFCSYEKIFRKCEFLRFRRDVVEWLRWSSRRKWISTLRWFVHFRRERLSSIISWRQFLSSSIRVFSSYLHQSASRWRSSWRTKVLILIECIIISKILSCILISTSYNLIYWEMLTQKHHVLLFANEKFDVLTAKMLKNQNSIFRRIVWEIRENS